MIRTYYIAAIFLIIGSILYGKNISLDYTWDENPVCTQVENEEDRKEGAFTLYEFERNEYSYTPYGALLMYYTYHKKVKVNNDEEINAFNKIYISLANVTEICDVRARSVNPDGSVVDFNKDNIKEIKGEEGSEGYKILAIEGIQKGADVEFYYINRMNAEFFGRTFFQNRYFIKKGRFELICPENIVFDFKVYNSSVEVSKVESTQEFADGRNWWAADFENVEALHTPRYAYYNSLRARIEFRLDRNRKIGEFQLYTWGNAAERVSEMVYQLTLGESKALRKFVSKELKMEVSLTEKQKILIAENYIKENILVQDYGSVEMSTLDFIIENKICTKHGMVKLMANVFDNLGLDYNIVLTTERSNVKFDGKFQSWKYLIEYLFYFPNIDLYLAPFNSEFRLGYVPALLTANDGLFIGKDEYGIDARIKHIDPLSYEKNYSNMLISIDIDTAMEKLLIKTELSMNGLSGGYLDQLYKVVDDNRKEDFLKSLMLNAPITNKLVTIETRDSSELSANDTIDGQRFVIYAEYESASLLEKAGKKYILNIGETIGEQIQMYFENDRNINVENSYNRWYYREIDLNLPKGYRILNPGVVDMNIVCQVEGKRVFGFETDHSFEGQEYRVTINEYYKEIFADKSKVNEFRDVVNAAADFNKISLILERE